MVNLQDYSQGIRGTPNRIFKLTENEIWYQGYPKSEIFVDDIDLNIETDIIFACKTRAEMNWRSENARGHGFLRRDGHCGVEYGTFLFRHGIAYIHPPSGGAMIFKKTTLDGTTVRRLSGNGQIKTRYSNPSEWASCLFDNHSQTDSLGFGK